MSQPFWSRPRLDGAGRRPPGRADVVVVGGGIAGVAALHHLVAAGADAVLLERDGVGAGASARNAGFLLTGVASCYAAAAADHGRDVAAAVWRFTAANHDVLMALLGGPERAAAARHRRDGAWTLAAGDEEATLLRESARLLAEDGLPGEWVDAPPLAPPGHHGGLLVPGDGVVDPGRLLTALGQAVASRIVAPVTVTALETAGTGVVARTTAGDVQAGAAVVATNAWIPELLPALPVAPVRAQMLATAPVEATLERRASYAHHGHRYWRQTTGGEVLVGGWRDTAAAEEVGFAAEPTAAVQDRLDAFLRGPLGAAGVAVTHRWAGIMGFTPDGLPLLGPVQGRPGLHVCGGFTGHGMGFAAHAALRVVRHLGGGEPPPAWASPARFA